MVTKIAVKAALYCYKDDSCRAGVFFEMNPGPDFFIVYYELPDIKILQYLQKFRFFQMAFTNNIDQLKNIAEEFIDEIADAIDDILVEFIDMFSLFLEPIHTVSENIAGYIDDLTSSSLGDNMVLDVGGAISEVASMYIYQRFEGNSN